MNNCPVYVQPPNKPKDRWRIGYLTNGMKPDAGDLLRWGLTSANILNQRWTKVGGESAYLIVAL